MGSWIYFILFGAVAGWFAGKLFKGKSFGFWANTVIGIAGGVLGGWFLNALGFSFGDGVIASLITAVIGGGLLVWIAGLLKK